MNARVPESQPRVLHLVPKVGPESFGLGPIALNLAKEQSELGFETTVWCLDDIDDARWASASSGLSENKIRCFPAIGPRRLGLSLAMERAASGPIGRAFDVVHQHGIWTGISRVTTVLHRRHGVPYVIAPHGSVARWALGRSKWKKGIAMLAYEARNLRDAGCLHATAEQEMADFRRLGLSSPIAVIRNGIADYWLRSKGDADSFRKRFNIPHDSRILLFLSRITLKKGLPMLIQAVDRCKEDLADWMLVVAGPDEFGHQAEVESIVYRLCLPDKVKFVGPLFDQVKRDAFSAADLFILPSYSEGDPIVVLECLATGVPAIVTKACSWADLSAYQCGWWIDISLDSICCSLREAAKLPKAQLNEMGQRGHNLVASKYTWSGSAKMTVELYNWLLGHRSPPRFVVLD